MEDTAWQTRESLRSFTRLIPRLEERFAGRTDQADWQLFRQRLERHFPRLFGLLHRLYGTRYDFFYHLETTVAALARSWLERPADLKGLDATREADPHWYQSHRMVGAVGYVDLFAGDLAGMKRRIPYLRELGVTYLHLMPLFRSPDGDNDGGYAISSYREVDPALGTMEGLAALARDLRVHGISLVLDFVFNHTSDEHDWARRALAGDEEYQSYYRMFSDRTEPDAYETRIRSVFPDEHPGCFTYRNRIRKWVWTTFHNYQWDLNYENPAVLTGMVEEMLFLANQGVEVLRLDAVPFIWKRKGTGCESLPEAHWIIQAFNAMARIAAPALVFKSEAIVHPDEVARYIGEDECQLSYNPLLMALLWEALATRQVRLLGYSLRTRFAIPSSCAWVNYVRGHDDIGWTFSDEDALQLKIDPRGHRRFLVDFYLGKHAASFAKGLAFQENPQTGDARVCGTTASLAGLEQALAEGSAEYVDLAVRRVLLLYGVVFTIGGIPLLYLGDEVGALNDYTSEDDPEKTGDARWVHRPAFDAQKAARRLDRETVEGRLFMGLLHLVQIRKNNLAFTRSETEIVDTGNDQVLGYFRQHDEQSVLCLANFSESPQVLPATRLRLLGLRKTFTDIVGGTTITATRQLELAPYQFMVLVGAVSTARTT